MSQKIPIFVMGGRGSLVILKTILFIHNKIFQDENFIMQYYKREEGLGWLVGGWGGGGTLYVVASLTAAVKKVSRSVNGNCPLHQLVDEAITTPCHPPLSLNGRISAALCQVVFHLAMCSHYFC